MKAEDDFSHSFKHVGTNLAVGAKIGAARAEFEYGVTKMGKKEDIKLGRQTFMLNGYYDFENSSILTPYVGAGVGIDVSKNVAVDVGYRYLKPSKSKWKEADGDSWKNKVGSNEAMVGVRFAF